MIDKATFEAHVRAEAERKYPEEVRSNGFASYVHRHGPERAAYVKRAMEHEWPLVECLQNIDLQEIGTPVCNCGGEATLIGALVANALSSYALSPDTTKPTDQ